MIVLRNIIAAFTLFFVFTMSVAGADDSALAAKFARLPQGEEPVISPDGSAIAFLKSPIDSDERFLVFRDFESGAEAGFSLGEAKVRDITWANNERLFINVSKTIDHTLYDVTVEVFRTLSINRDGSDAVWLFDDRDFSWSLGSPELIHLLPDDKDHVLMAQWDVGSGKSSFDRVRREQTYSDFIRYSAYKVNIANGKLRRVGFAEEDTQGWIADPDGVLRLRIDYKDGINVIDILKSDDGKNFSRIASFEKPDGRGAAASVAGYGADGRKIYAFSTNNRTVAGLYLLDPATGQLGAAAWSNNRYDINGALVDPDTRAIIGVYYEDDVERNHYFDEDLADLQTALTKAFGGHSTNILSTSWDGARIVLSVEAPGEPVSYAFFDKNTRQAGYFANEYPEIAGSALGRMRKFDYRTSDNTEIPGYLTMPAGKSDAKTPPLIVLPHGGPASRDTMTFDYWAQYYAALGFAVYQPNFRGSSGFGRRFQYAGDGEWGRRMQADIDEGVAALIQQGLADKDRICIVGASYGGYAALAGGAYSGDLYKCVVAVAPVSDLVKMRTYTEEYAGKTSESVAYWRRSIGGKMDALAAVSPANAAGAFTAPVLLIHGKDDTVVPYEQSERMAGALKGAGKNVELVTLDGEDHWLTRRSSRVELLERSGAFLKTHLRPGAN